MTTIGDVQSRAIQPARRRLLPFLLLMYVVAFLDRTNIGFAKQAFQLLTGISESAFTRGAGLFFLTYALFEIPSNLIMHRAGARIWMCASWSFGAWSPSQPYLCAAPSRFISSVCWSGSQRQASSPASSFTSCPRFPTAPAARSWDSSTSARRSPSSSAARSPDFYSQCTAPAACSAGGPPLPCL